MRRVALHGFDEVRDEVVAALELDVDLGPSVVDTVPQPDEPVVQDDERQPEQDGDHDRDDDPGLRCDSKPAGGRRSRSSLRRPGKDAGRTSRSARGPRSRPARSTPATPAARATRAPSSWRPRSLGPRGSGDGARCPTRRARRCPARAPASGRASPRCPPRRARRRRRRAGRPARAGGARPRARAGAPRRLQMEERAEGRRDERHLRSVDRRVGEVAEAEVHELRHAGELGVLRAHLEHPARRVDPDHRTPAAAVGTAMRPVPTPSSTTRPASLRERRRRTPTSSVTLTDHGS